MASKNENSKEKAESNVTAEKAIDSNKDDEKVDLVRDFFFFLLYFGLNRLFE